MRSISKLLPLLVLLTVAACQDGILPKVVDAPAVPTPSTAGAPMDGQNYLDRSTNTIHLSYAGKRWGYRDWDTFLACNGTHPNRYESVSSLSQLALSPGGTLPSVRGHGDRNEWMRGRRPVQSGNGTIWVVVGCVKAGIPNAATFEAIFGNTGWNQIVVVPPAVLDSIPTGPNATAPVRPSGALIRGSSGEVRWVTYHGASLAISSPDVLSSHCRSFTEVLWLSDTEFNRHPSKGLMQMGPGGCTFATPTSDGFDYPTGVIPRVTQSNDGDGWYNAQDFAVYYSGKGYHLGEDWNGEDFNDCGRPVYASTSGRIHYADNAGAGWGNVIIVRHRLPNGSEGETMYAHLQAFIRTSGEVRRGEQIGLVGDGGGAYPCHLHFEFRFPSSYRYGFAGPGYSSSPAPTGWTDPSNYIDSNRRF